VGVKKAICTANSPQPAGPYSQGLRANGLVFVAGQGPRDPISGLLAEGIAAQTHQVLRNIRAILEAGGCSLDDVVKVSAHLANMTDFDAFNGAYAQYFHEPYPVRTTVGSQLPGILVEIDAIAVRPGS
jgi:reactive intermediate/imine deaminase